MKGRLAEKISGTALAALLAAAGVARAQTDAEGKYRGVGVARAGEIAYPVNTSTPGMVTLDVSVEASGAVQKIVTARGVPPLTSAAESGVQEWKFSPAMAGGRPTAGVVRVNVVFNPFNPGDVMIPTKPLPPPEILAGESSRVFSPADVNTAKYAVYPANTVASGTVVLDVKVGNDGRVMGVRVLGGLGVLSGTATRAIKDWAFVAASYEGKAVESETIVAFVFVSPAVGTM